MRHFADSIRHAAVDHLLTVLATPCQALPQRFPECEDTRQANHGDQQNMYRPQLNGKRQPPFESLDDTTGHFRRLQALGRVRGVSQRVKV